MDSQSKVCSTCHWWFKREQDRVDGDCVLLTGLRTSKVRKANFRGILSTAPDFGCNQWMVDTREKTEDVQ